MIGIVPQQAVLFTGTIRENIQWGKKDASDSEIKEALRIAQATFVDELDEGLDSMIHHIYLSYNISHKHHGKKRKNHTKRQV